MFRGYFATKFSGSSIKSHPYAYVSSIAPISLRPYPPIPVRQFRVVPSPRIPLVVFPLLKLAKVRYSLFSCRINHLVYPP
jgi:hypothetical protein